MCDFVCDECGSAAFTLPRRLKDESPVACAECGAVLGTWAERRAEIERMNRGWPEEPAGAGRRASPRRESLH
jgi:hypothetical protein